MYTDGGTRCAFQSIANELHQRYVPRSARQLSKRNNDSSQTPLVVENEHGVRSVGSRQILYG